MTDSGTSMRDLEWVSGRSVPTLVDMFSTWLTKRRAVDHCRTRSSLCRMS